MSRADDRVMIAAQETAQRNPMRPPDTLPRDGRGALALFVRHHSPQLIAAAVLAALGVRLLIGRFGWADLATALAVWAYFPVNEWLIHVFMLHYRPRRLFGRTIDFYLPVTHRRHHADPWNLRWVFIPRHVHLWVFPLIALLAWLAGPWRGPVLSGLCMYLLLGLHYEWVHYLAHIPWCPGLAYYRRRVREHRYHHFRNENYWWGVSMGLGDRLFGTAPAVEETGRSGTTASIGARK
ncbi:MAG: sterol desaturase family protein [Nevskia sp.]|nr:sterol desaturase family protein [Nevskia sp.]